MNQAVKNFQQAIRNLGNAFVSLFQKTGLQVDLKWTNYNCTSCGCTLIIKEHTQDTIYYECYNCGKIHKAPKNRVLGRFK